jgi:hypothetical protein
MNPSTPEVVQTKECTPTSFLSVVFTFGLAVESIKELGDASKITSTYIVMFQTIIFMIMCV